MLSSSHILQSRFFHFATQKTKQLTLTIIHVSVKRKKAVRLKKKSEKLLSDKVDKLMSIVLESVYENHDDKVKCYSLLS